jgi:hypothetical protein
MGGLKLSDYWKAIVTALVTGATVIATALDDNDISNIEWLQAIIAVAGSTGVVWYVTNGPGGQYAKSFFAGVTAGASALIIAMQDGALSQQELVTAVIAILAGLGFVWAVPGPEPVEVPPPTPPVPTQLPAQPQKK